jgi:hypothetical protein
MRDQLLLVKFSLRSWALIAYNEMLHKLMNIYCLNLLDCAKGDHKDRPYETWLA